MPQNLNPNDPASYRDRLNNWAIVRLLPNAQRATVARFRRRADADGHLRFLKRSMPEDEFMLVFDRHPNHQPEPER